MAKNECPCGADNNNIKQPQKQQQKRSKTNKYCNQKINKSNKLASSPSATTSPPSPSTPAPSTSPTTLRLPPIRLPHPESSSYSRCIHLQPLQNLTDQGLMIDDIPGQDRRLCQLKMRKNSRV